MMHQTNSGEVFIAEKTTFDRLKQKKNRRKLGVDEWNVAVAEAMRIPEMAERGELADDEMKAQFRAL